jgi:hypothetical protein
LGADDDDDDEEMEVVREEDNAAWWTDGSASGKKGKKKSTDEAHTKHKVKVSMPSVFGRLLTPVVIETNQERDSRG